MLLPSLFVVSSSVSLPAIPRWCDCLQCAASSFSSVHLLSKFSNMCVRRTAPKAFIWSRRVFVTLVRLLREAHEPGQPALEFRRLTG
eukprot:15300907-Alexandrium_andersonii.AAC.1